MFNFMKKGSVEKDEKEKRKKEKEGKKKRERVGMTAEELLRIDEMRRSLKIRSRRKEKEKLPSGITADYSENFFAELDRNPEYKSGSLPGHSKTKNSPTLNRDGLTQSDSSEASLNSLHNQTQKILPPLPPRPPKRGILKGSKASLNTTEYCENDPNNATLVVRNTLQNELITYQNIPQKNDISKSCVSPDRNGHSGNTHLSVDKNNYLTVISTSPSAESLTDTTNSSFATPPFSMSPVGESQGFISTHSNLDDKNLNLPLPDIIPMQLPKPRELVIHRTQRGDFGFQLRRAIITDKLSSVNKKTVIFAEPGALISNRNDTGLLPGDILLEVNGVQVQNKSREDIIDLIKSSGSSVTVKVQPIPELCELTRRSGLDGHYVNLDDNNIRGGTLKRSGSLRFKKISGKSEEDLANEKDTEKFWLVHRGGFTAVRALLSSASHQLDAGKVKVKVESSNEILEVDEDDLEKANPPQLDKVEDISLLRYINESSALYLLRQRFGNNLIHTYAAGNLIVTNPQCTLSIYNEKVAALFRGCKSEDMPPHIYALAQTSYRSLLSTRKDQSIVLLGRSGSGKTHNFRHILSYLFHSSGAVNKVLNVEKLNALHTVLEAFGNARTCLNVNATRCTNLISLDFDQTGQIASLSVQMLMLEKQRVARRPDGEGTFNVFYWLLAGAEGSLAKQLFLDSTTQNTNLFINALYKNEDRQRAVIELSKLSLALKALGVSEKENFVLWSVIAAIYHLGNAGTVRVATNKWQFADPVHSSRACRLLGTTSEELCQALWNSPASPSRTPSPGDKDKTVSGVEALEGFVIGLYSEVVNIVNNLINRCLTTNVHSSMSFVVVDSPGVQNPGSLGQQRGALFTDLCHNYVQERLHLLFHNVNLVAPRDRYTQEHIDVNIEDTFGEFNFPYQLVSMLDKSPPSGVLKTSQTDLREIDRRGLLFLLDEETLYPNSSDETFLERLFQHYGGKDHQMLIRRSGNENFVIHHLQGTNPIIYNGRGLVKASKENLTTRAAVNFLQESTKEEISELFVKGKGGLLSAGAEGSQSLRRVSSIRRTCSAAIKRKSISLQVKFTADSLIETLRRTRPRFVFCMLPHHNAGNTEITTGPATGENSLNVPLLRSQLRGFEILPAVRMFKQGFPEYYPHGEFRRRFRLLAPGNASVSESTISPSQIQITINGHAPEALDEARAVEEMLLQMDVDVTSYRIGLSQVFFRAGVLAQLESQRDEKLADLIIHLQSRCRGYLARKKLAKLKVQDLAVRCIQRNVRKLMQVREWPWWRLYVQVTPLLNVHRTEEELTAKIHELEIFKATLEKLEQERNQLKLENDKLETKSCEEENTQKRTRMKMETNLGFFAAWRTKRKEKQKQECEKTSTEPTEGGILQKYLRLRNEGLSAGNELDEVKEEASKPTEDDSQIPKSRKKPGEISSISVCKAHFSKNENLERNSSENLHSEEALKNKNDIVKKNFVNSSSKSSTIVRRKSIEFKSPSGSRRSSFDSRRNSITSPFGSVLDIQGKLLALSKEQTDLSSRKPPKVNKLNEDALRIGKTSPNGQEEAKIPSKGNSEDVKENKKLEEGSIISKTEAKTTAKAIPTSKLSQVKATVSKTSQNEKTEGAKYVEKNETINKKLLPMGENKSQLGYKNEPEDTTGDKKDLKSISVIKPQETSEVKPKAKTESHGLLNLEVRKSNENLIDKIGFKPIHTEFKISSEKPLPEVQKPQPLKESFDSRAVVSINTAKKSTSSETVSSLEAIKIDLIKDKTKNVNDAQSVESINKKQIVEDITKVGPRCTKIKAEKSGSDIIKLTPKKSQEKLPEDKKKESETKVTVSKLQEALSKTTGTNTQMSTSDASKINSHLKVIKLEDSTKGKSGTAILKGQNQKEVNKVEKTEENTSESNLQQKISERKEANIPLSSKAVQIKEVNTPKTNKILQNEGGSSKNESIEKKVIKEAINLRENMTELTNRVNQIGKELPERETKILKCIKSTDDNDISETSCKSQESGSESISLRKDPQKLLRKLKSKQNPDVSYPKTQKLLFNKPINAFEQVKLEETKNEAIVSPSKVEAFLRETISPPVIPGRKEPVKMMEAVVEEIVTNKSDQSKHEKPSQTKYTSKGEVICGVVSIKPSNMVEETDSLSAITLIPAFLPEKSFFEKDGERKNEQTSDYFSDTENVKKVEKMLEISEVPENDKNFRNPERFSKEKSFSPISDFSDDSYDHYVASVDYSLNSSSYSRYRSFRSSPTPRRIFPQVIKFSPYRSDLKKEEFPVVFDAGLSFDLSSNRASLRHHFKPQPAFTDIKTNSSFLSMRIADFLKRTDHIMEEWKHLGKSSDDLQSLVQLPSSSASGSLRSKRKSATNIMIKGLLNYSKGSRTPSLRSRSAARTTENSDRTISDIDELSEMTLDLSEERASGMMQAERLEAETAERVRLEQEVAQIQNEKKNLQQTSERLEMELFYARAEVNGLSESEADFEDGGGDAALYKNKCERAMRELEFTRRRLQQQHEDDLEQLVGLKKQLEKKLTDAYEEVEEQRQVAAQWKRKVQKLQSETNDLRLLLEEQSSRNNMLEKKQRKFDSEIQMLQEELRSERSQKERMSREKEMAVAEKYSLEQNLSSVRLELELKEEKVSALTRELEELSRGGGTEQEVTQLRKAKHDLEMKLKDQEEELDELAGQVSMLEGNKLRLEMSLESLRKEHRREMAARDDELDEVRANAQKKIKVLESQLESEHEERTLLVREKHELERRLADAEDRVRHHRAADEDALQRARRDLKKTKALLRDAQVMLERAKQDSPTKAALRALKNQLEDAELARASAVKAKQSLEAEFNEVTGQLEEVLRAKGDAENRCQAALREMNSLRTQVDENEEELAELLKKYRQTVQQLSAEQLANQETAGALAEAEAERASLRDQLAEMSARLEANTTVDPISGLAQKKLEIRIKELESRLELEQTTRGRLEVQITRLKENVERLNEECVQARTKEQAATDLTRKLQRSLRETKEQLAALQAKDQEAIHKRKELEKRLETAEQEASTARTDLRLAVKRIEDLQSAISGEIGSDSERSGSDEEDSGDDSLMSHVPSTISSASRVSRTPEITPR